MTSFKTLNFLVLFHQTFKNIIQIYRPRIYFKMKVFITQDPLLFMENIFLCLSIQLTIYETKTYILYHFVSIKIQEGQNLFQEGWKCDQLVIYNVTSFFINDTLSRICFINIDFQQSIKVLLLFCFVFPKFNISQSYMKSEHARKSLVAYHLT